MELSPAKKERQALQQSAAELVRNLAPLFLPANARKYTWHVRSGHAVENMLGLPADPPVDEGLVVDVTPPWVVLKVKPTKFVLYHESILAELPEPGSKVRLEAYAKRDFTGQRLDAPRTETRKSDDGTEYEVRCLKIGDTRSPLPIPAPQGAYLTEMVKLFEYGKSPDGMRTLAQILVDAKATDFATVDTDLDRGDVFANPPAIGFTVCTKKYQGRVEFQYDRGGDWYVMRFGDEVLENLCPDQIGEVLLERVDDGHWRYAKLEVLSTAPRAKRAARP
jgi:hypothetical protein